MDTYINVNRRFYKSSDPQEEIPESCYADWFEDSNTIGWNELLAYPHAIILGEAGSGKTREMKEQSARLNQSGHFSFFIPIEALAKESITELFRPDELVQFEQWQNSTEQAYLFLDAVDELKINNGKFEQALRKACQQLGNNLPRVKLFISCRPSDWSNYDINIIKQWLPNNSLLENKTPIGQEKMGRELLIDIVTRRQSPPLEDNPLDTQEESTDDAHLIHCFYLRPMGNRQIRNFSETFGVSNINQFLQQLSHLNAEAFASRPQDLITVINYWNHHQQLDSKLAIYDADIQNKITESSERSGLVSKSNHEIKEAVERLALAISLTHKRTISITDRPSSDAYALDPAQILTGWLPKDIKALLRLAIFEPATYERVRFYHRSVQEYLAACRLRYLTERGMPVKERFHLLFSNSYGMNVVIPSMRPITAWLSIWDGDVRKELMKREPETLLSDGDPGSLSLEIRSTLLKSFVALYSHGTSRGINIPLAQVARLSHPDLQPTIEQLWASGYQNDDVRELLIETIWVGKIQGCNALLEQAVYDPQIEITDRIIAIKAIITTNDLTLQRKIIYDVIHNPTLWPDEFIFHFVEEFFPQILSIDDLLTLIKRTPEPKSSTNGFKWVLCNIAMEIDPISDPAIVFRDKITQLILNNNIKETRRYHPESQYGYLARSLVKICARQLAQTPQQKDKDLIYSCLVGQLFISKDSHLASEEISAIKLALNSMSSRRKYIFQTEWLLLNKVVRHDIRVYHIEEYSILSLCEQDDPLWMIELLSEEPSLEPRTTLLDFILKTISQNHIIANFQETLFNAVKNEDSLLTIVNNWLTPKPIDHDDICQQKTRKIKEENRQKEKCREHDESIKNWSIWYDKIISDSTCLFSDETQFSNLHNIVLLLQNINRSYAPEDLWNKKTLLDIFGDDITKNIEQAFHQYWRNIPTQLWSERCKEAKNSLTECESIAIIGLYSESESQGWQCSLNETETSLAVKYALFTTNAFAPFIKNLALTFPDIVKSIIDKELQCVINAIDGNHYIPIIHNIANADWSLRTLLSDNIINTINNHITTINKDTDTIRAIEYLLVSLIDTTPIDKKENLAQNCASAYMVAPYKPEFYVFLRYAFIFSPDTGMKTLEHALIKCRSKKKYIINLYAALFSHQAVRKQNSIFPLIESHKQVLILARLLDIAYQFIKREEDQVHDGIFTPNTRDNAEGARNNILSNILDINDESVKTEILKLTLKKHFKFSKDRLEYLIRERAAHSSEVSSLTERDMLNLEEQLEQVPHDQKSLYRVMVNRLHDLQYALSHSDFTDRDILRTVKLETHMQATLAWRLEAASKSAYSVIRESEVADGKKTDIRLLSPCGKHKAVIELKLADNRWGIDDFERALEHQLVGQYLRYESCKSGCLLLTYNGEKKYWLEPQTKNRLYFKELIEYLNSKAKILMTKDSSFRLIVIGLDLTAPELVPAHR